MTINPDKTCFKCGKNKPLTEFYRHFRMADGFLNKCKECTKKDVAKHRRDNIEKFKKYDRSRGMLPHRIVARKIYKTTELGKAAFKRSTEKYRKQHPDRRAANIILGNAIRDGRIQKKPCEVCGSIVNIHGHHNDYTKPLDVIWLCAQHHKDLHNERLDMVSKEEILYSYGL